MHKAILITNGLLLNRWTHTLTAVGKQLFLFGGWTYSENFNDLHIFDTGASVNEGGNPCEGDIMATITGVCMRSQKQGLGDWRVCMATFRLPEDPTQPPL